MQTLGSGFSSDFVKIYPVAFLFAFSILTYWIRISIVRCEGKLGPRF